LPIVRQRATRGHVAGGKKTVSFVQTSLELRQNPWLLCVTETNFFPSNEDTPMATATTRPSAADLLYARTATLELIEELHAAVKDMPILEAAEPENFDRYFGELDDLHDAIDGLAAKFQKNIRG
jgi:hypothetical protein